MNRGLIITRTLLLLSGLFLIILGARIFIGIRFVSPMPQADDWATMAWLQDWFNGHHHWSYIWQRENEHPIGMYLGIVLLHSLLNGFWDARLDFLAATILHAIYALAILLIFRKVVENRDRAWLTGFIVFLFTFPFAGYRINWGILWPHSAMMLFGLWALYFAIYKRESWLGVAGAVVLAELAALNMAAGCLAALMIAALTGLRAVLERRVTGREMALAGATLAIFVVFYFGVTQKGRAAGILEGIDALLKALAWPVVFSPLAGLLTLVPFVGLALAYVASARLRTRRVEYLLAVAGLLFLISVATGIQRGENNNMGMPSGRYVEVFVMVPVVCALILVEFFRASSGRVRLGWAIFGWLWLAVQVMGFSVHILYRTLPFIARENGEWPEANKEAMFRDVSRGVPHALGTPADALWWNSLSPLVPLPVMQGKEPVPALTLPMVTGFPLTPGSQGNFVPGGYLPAYMPRPGELYMGSFDAEHPAASEEWFISAPFRPTAPYVVMDLLLDKKARFSNYHLEGVQLLLRDVTSGQSEELLPQLSHRFPFIFRDWESVYARVQPGHEYRIESYVQTAQNWIAIGEPFESGRLTPFTVMATQSGKLLCLAGLGLFTLFLGVGFFGRMFGWVNEESSIADVFSSGGTGTRGRPRA